MMLAMLAAAALLQPVDIQKLAKEISPQRMQEIVEHLAAFVTRNTNTPECRKAAEWVAAEYRKIPGMQVELMTYAIKKGRRVLEDKEVVQVVATLPGQTDNVLMMGGHLDSINMSSDADPLTARAPGANDDLSGVAAAMEVARVMAPHRWRQTLMFIAFTGEEQGLLGSRALAARAKSEAWKVDAVLSNDMVGSSRNKLGLKDTKHIRVFSEERNAEDANATHSRELARFMEYVARETKAGLSVKLVFRRDRFGRGGDHTAVRLTEVHEEYSQQHTVADLPEHMDWQYLAQAARLNLAALATLAQAHRPPQNVRVKLDQSHHTTITWDAVPGVEYRVFWRDTASPTWQGSMRVGEVNQVLLEKINKDDHLFAVGAEGGVPVLAR